MFPTREWGFESPPGHHALRARGVERDGDGPRFGELVRHNARLVAGVLVAAGAAWLVWRGLVWLFPDVEWLQPPETR